MEWFPITVAVGKAFCNRVQQRRLLKQYIKHGRHSVLLAPRRYGKTSLINQVLLEAKLPYTIMELTLATSLADVEQIIIKHVGDLLHSILPKTTRVKQAVLKLFKWLNPELVLTVAGQKLVFHPQLNQTRTSENVAEVLKKLDEAAQLIKKRVVVVMDEFQQLNEIQNHAIEASIRHAMQYSKHVSYIFSGSNRHMLQNLFHNKHRPFYHACETLKLERIAVEDYRWFIQQAAKEHWKKPLPQLVLDEILRLSERHPSYINQICGYFWLVNTFPTLDQVKAQWRAIVESKRAEFTEDILRLSKNQKKLLVYLANVPTAHPSHRDVCKAVGLSEASVRQAVRKLMLNDYIIRNEQGVIHLLDPAFKDFIRNRN